MASGGSNVSFANKPRGRSGRVPLSYYSPVMIDGDQPFWKVMPTNAVPTGMGDKNQQIGYWNEQPRWRMVKGQRKELPSKWHFYYLGTGPQEDARYRQRIEGVFWVAVQSSKTDPTGLGTRRKGQDLISPKFAVKIPSNVVVVEETSRPPSRSQSNSRPQSRNNSRPQSKNNSQNNSRDNSRAPSRPRSRANSTSSSANDAVDIVAAVKQALKELGVTPEKKNQEKQKKSKKSNSGSNTPKEAATPKQKSSPSTPRKQLERPEWKRVPNKEENVTACFGPRDTLHNFGDQKLIVEGVQAPHYPQLAELVPTPAALLFGGEVSTRERGDEVEIMYVYKMKVHKSNKDLPSFLQQVSAYAQAPDATTTEKATVQPLLNPTAPDFKPATSDEVIEMINTVYDSFDA
uniref:Nucleoprotein n=1 Tax=Hipposideros bat coronavirus HKU10 TaxID=1241932 RepID=K4K2W1_9ALPC|nr:nucleocapsid protein [Hipposideros bat coronavirus HKU10]AFU92135.1 nucleocapsid protein [Hipposideros bat coronavirus HKU10]